MRFGEKLRSEREKQHLSAHDLALTCGVARSYITLIENSKRLPGKKILPKIATALHIDMATVINWYLEDIRRQVEKSTKSTT